MIHRGFQFLQIPGPTNVPERILRAMARPTIDHRGPEFQRLISGLLPGLQEIFKTVNPVVVFPASGTGAWEAALVNTLSAGDHVLMYETGHFAMLWHELAVLMPGPSKQNCLTMPIIRLRPFVSYITKRRLE